MKWAVDVHKYLSEITRVSLQVFQNLNLRQNASVAEIRAATRMLVERGVYREYNEQVIRRHLITNLKSYNLIDDDWRLTELGQKFANGEIEVNEVAFMYVCQYRYVNGNASYYPLYRLLCCLEEKRNRNVQKAYISAFDFLRIQNNDGPLSADFFESLIANEAELDDKERRNIGFDVWAKLLSTAEIFEKRKNILYPKNLHLIKWIVEKYEH